MFFHHLHRTALLSLITILTAGPLWAQPYSSSSKKAVKLFEQALSDYRAYNHANAEENAKAALEKDDDFTEAYLLLSDIYEAQKKYKQQADILSQVLRKNPDKERIIMLKLIEVELKTGQYSSADSHIKHLANRNLPKQLKSNLDSFKKAAAFALNAIKNPVEFEPVNCGPVVNSEFDDYFPAITADGLYFYKTVNLPTGNKDAFGNEFFQEDLYIIERKADGTPLKAKPLHNAINTAGNEGAFTISQDGQTVFFTVCSHSRGASYHGAVHGSCDIFEARISAREIEIFNCGKPLNTSDWESQPSFSSDGKTLYFVSDRTGGFGKSDIWKAEQKEDGSWGEPQNLGETINTKGEERTPFIHADGRTLYFSSDSHPGMGGLDIFLSQRDEKGEWSKPKNLGYPINTHEDESGFIVDALGDSAYFSGKRTDGFGGLDIYRFALNKENRPDKTAYITGRVYNARNNMPLQTTLYLYNTETGNLRAKTRSNAKGSYTICINAGSNYAFHVNKPGYMLYSEQFMLREQNTINDNFTKNIPLEPIEKGKKTVLKNVFFDIDDHHLRPESYPELNRLAEFMKHNPGLRIEIAGHTDNSGSDTHNMTLSLNRAKSVYNYLSEKGIPKSAISYKGYGSSQPKVKNNSPENRQLNRRTEFSIIEK